MTAARSLANAERPQTLGEEIANAISHGVGFAFAIASLPILLSFAPERSTAINIIAVCVFSLSMTLLYGVSTLYHAWPVGRAKTWLNRLDHAAIYVFIAGSYTPFVLGVLRGGWGWSLFATIWTMAVLGVTVKLLDRLKHPLWSTGLYVAMGWLAVVAATSSAVPKRCIGIVLRIVSSWPGGRVAWISVSMMPGRTAFTRMPSPATSFARPIVIVSIAPLVAA